MNKYQSIILILGFLVIAFTWVWGSSNFALNNVGADSTQSGRIRYKVTHTQRIEQNILTKTVIAETVAVAVLTFILGYAKDD